MNQKFKRILSKFQTAKVFIIGDLILDVFIWGKVRRISPEAPVPVVEVEKDSYVPGGAANVANNIGSLGGKVWLGGVIGNDPEGYLLSSQLKKRGISLNAVIHDESRPTTIKTRVVAHHQQVVRIDREKIRPLEEKIQNQILDRLKKIGDEVGGILIEDYGKGVVQQNLVFEVIDYAKRMKIPVAVDPKKGHLLDYRGITFATPNLEEAAYFAGIEHDPYSSLNEIGFKLLERWDCKAVLVTLGDRGMCLFEREQKPYHIDTVAREIFDVSGAGDTVIGSFMVSLLGGASFKEAARIANTAAGIVVGKLGTAVVYKDEIEKELKNVR